MVRCLCPEEGAVIRAVLFDGYGTLFSGGMDKLYEVCQRICDDHGVGLDGRGFLHEWDQFFFPLIRGEHFLTFRKAHAESLTVVFEKLGIEARPDRYVEQIFRLLGEVTLYDEVSAPLAALDGFPHGAVSNADSDHLHNALSSNDLQFDLVVSSESAAAYKPNPAIFVPALQALKADAREVLYVGDSQEDDIVAASRCGMQVAWLNREGDTLQEGIPEPTFEICLLSEVLTILSDA